ncbi:unnamed protein product, partial [Musa hybrid cultivar]
MLLCRRPRRARSICPHPLDHGLRVGLLRQYLRQLLRADRHPHPPNTLLRRTQHLQVLESCCPLVTHRSTCAPTGSACSGGRRRSHDVLDSSGGLRLHFCDGFRVYTDATMSFTNFCAAITSSSYRRA